MCGVNGWLLVFLLLFLGQGSALYSREICGRVVGVHCIFSGGHGWYAGIKKSICIKHENTSITIAFQQIELWAHDSLNPE